MVEEGRDVTRLPVDNTRNLFGIMRVYEDVVIMQIIMPETGAGDGCILWDKGIDDLSVTCQSSYFLFRVWPVELWATE